MDMQQQKGGAPSFGSTLKYKKPTHTVRYYDSVNSNPIDTRSVSDGNKASSAGVPSDPTRTGYSSLDGEIQLMKVHGIKQSVEQKIFMLNGKNNIV